MKAKRSHRDFGTVMRLPIPPDPQHCPLCGEVNRCAMELAKKSGITQPACWCTQANFSPSLLASVPPASQGLACICAACAESATLSHRTESASSTH